MIRHYLDVVASLEARVAEGERAGIYGDSGVLTRFRLPPTSPPVAKELERPAPLRLNPARGYSSKALVGPLITAAKRTGERLLNHVVQDGLDQVTVHLERQMRDLRWAEINSEYRDAELMRATRQLLAHEAGRRRELERTIAALSEELGRATPGAAPPATIQQVLAAAVPHDAVRASVRSP